MKTEKQVLYGIFSVYKALLVDTKHQQRWRSHHNNVPASNRGAFFMWPKAVPQVLIDANEKEKVYCGEYNALRGS